MYGKNLSALINSVDIWTICMILDAQHNILSFDNFYLHLPPPCQRLCPTHEKKLVRPFDKIYNKKVALGLKRFRITGLECRIAYS